MHSSIFSKKMPFPALRRALLVHVAAASCLAAQVINIDDRVELLGDGFLIERLSGDIKAELQQPEAKEVVMEFDMPWEGNTTGAYFSIFQDGEIYRMYYRGARETPPGSKTKEPEVICYAESKDGIRWERPPLELFQWPGSKVNNIVWMGDSAAHNLSVFKDANPEASPEKLYKAIGQKRGPRAYQSPDGIHWQLTEDRALVSNGTFDSQNLAFWDEFRKEYRMYWRYNPKADGGPFSVRAIRTATSKDFLHWENIQELQYPGKPEPQTWEEAVQLYTSAILPYFRAPHIFLGFPTRMISRGESTEPWFMMSRDGVRFTRWDDAVIPRDAPQDRSGNRSNFMAWGLLQLPGAKDKVSVYASENYRAKTPPRLRRFEYRIDGFVPLVAGNEGGEAVTTALLFSGNKLLLNYRTKKDGELRVEIQDENGVPLPGFSLEECDLLQGDSVAEIVRWKGDGELSGAPSQEAIRLRFSGKNVEIYSLQFVP